MANYCNIPYLNPVRFYEAQPEVFAQYLTKHFTDYPYADQILPWQEPMRYSQKWQTSDTIYLQIQSNFEPLQLDVISRVTGQTLLTLNANSQIPNIYNPGFYAYQFTISLASIPPNQCYHLQLTNGPDLDLYMISEPFYVATKHPNTVLLEYRNSRFAGDVVFETGITFGFRVEGSFGFLDPGANITAYENQKADPQILSARPFRIWPLTIGGSFGVPDWVVDLYNLIWCCNDVKVDGKSFARSGDAKLTFKTEDNYPMRGVTLELREGINRGSKIVSPTINTDIKLAVAFNLNTRLFGDLSSNSSSNLIPIIDTI
jgi:hypothetical protein